MAVIIGCSALFKFKPGAKEELHLRIDEILSAAGENAVLSVEVIEYPSGEVVYQRNSAYSLIPASNTKLFTTAAALKFLGAEYQISTRIMTDGDVDSSGVLRGDLYLIGGGDPAISRRFTEDDPLCIFREWAAEIADWGVIQINGDIIAVDTLFAPSALESSWEWGDLFHSYAAPASALTFNDNCIDLELYTGEDAGAISCEWYPPLEDFTVTLGLEIAADQEEADCSWRWAVPDYELILTGVVKPNEYKSMKIPVKNPPLYFIRAFNSVLEEEEGISVYGEPKLIGFDESSVPAESLELIIEHRSPPLTEIIEVINTESVNLYAELVLRTLGSEVYNQGSPQAGLMAIDSMLFEAMIEPGGTHLVDGSGLSRHNWLSAGTIVDLLEYCRISNFGEEFLNSLPQYGEGTLKRRKLETPEFEIRAKTGSMSGVRAFSGYLYNEKGGYIFSFLCNNYMCSPVIVERAMDEALRQIRRR